MTRNKKDEPAQEDGQEIGDPKAKRSALDPTIDEAAGHKATVDQRELSNT